MRACILLTAALASMAASPLAALGDLLTFQLGTGTRKIEANILAKDSKGTLLVEGRDSSRYIIAKNELFQWERRGEAVAPYSTDLLRRHLEAELGGRFRFWRTTHYLIASSADPVYSREAAKLLERAHAVFTNYFAHHGGFRFERPKQHLVAVLYGSREEYLERVTKDVGDLASRTSGVYVRTSNRMHMYDALGGKVGELVRAAERANPAAARESSALLRSQNISVVIHEAIHQIAFNVGFHDRQGDPPTWLTEGMAMFFEAPDLDASGGWRGAGSINRERLEHFETIFWRRPKDSLARLVTQDDAFRGGKALDAYAEAWALTYFLAKTRPNAYIRYLRKVNARPALRRTPPAERLADFQAAFGKQPADLDADLRRFLTPLFAKSGRSD